MAKVAMTIQGIRFEMDAKAVPAFLASMNGKANPVQQTASKTYIGEKDLKEIAKNSKTAEEYAITALSKQDGIHVVFSGFNKIMRDVYDVNPSDVTKGLEEAGLITINPTKGGVRITLKK